MPHYVRHMQNAYLLVNQFTARLRFRAIEPGDFAHWLPFFQNPENFAHWNEVIDDPHQACVDWYAKQFDRYHNQLGGMNALIEQNTGALVGHAGLVVQTVDAQREVEIAYSLLPQYWGRGYATEAAAACRDFAFCHGLAPSLISIISLTNVASQRVALKNGMRVQKETVYKGNRVLIFRIHAPG